jgi:hypothetical protein
LKHFVVLPYAFTEHSVAMLATLHREKKESNEKEAIMTEELKQIFIH